MPTIRVALVVRLRCRADLRASPAVLPEQVQIQQEVFIGPDAPPMWPMPGRQPRTGTGRIRGRVLSAETGAPLRRAQVRLTGPDIGSKTAHDRRRRPLRVPDLPDGRFTRQRIEVRLRQRAVRADAAVRVGQADRAGRQAGRSTRPTS